MSATHDRTHRAPTEQAVTPWLARAWTAVAAIPVFFVIAFAVGEGLYDLFGYDAGANTEPAWVALVIAAAVLAVCLLPCVAAAYAGRRATTPRDRRGRVPAVLGVLAGAGLTILTLVSTIGDLVRR